MTKKEAADLAIGHLEILIKGLRSGKLVIVEIGVHSKTEEDVPTGVTTTSIKTKPGE